MLAAEQGDEADEALSTSELRSLSPVLDAMNAVACLVLVLVLAHGRASAETPWEAYLALPTPENATQVEEISYSPGAIPASYGYLATDLDVLSIQVLAGDVEAFRLAYRLRSTADGGLLEDLTIILGRAIRSQPVMFVEQMASLQPDEQSLKSILMNPGLEYVDRPDAKRYEIAMRRRAIASIQNADLRPTRDQCLALMTDERGI